MRIRDVVSEKESEMIDLRERAQMAERKWQGADGTQVAGRTRKEVGGIDVGSVSGKGAHVHPPLSGVPAQVYTRAPPSP